jgi:hypothetical protein
MNLLKTLIYVTSLALLFACSGNDNPTPGVGSANTNYEPQLSFTFEGVTYTAASTTNTLGGKIYVLGLDDQGNLLIDLDIPVAKNETANGKTFKIENEDGFGNCIFYIGSEQWTIEGGILNVTKNENQRISGSFSGKAYRMDYSQSPPAKVEESTLSNGLFKDLLVE